MGSFKSLPHCKAGGHPNSLHYYIAGEGLSISLFLHYVINEQPLRVSNKHLQMSFPFLVKYFISCKKDSLLSPFKILKCHSEKSFYGTSKIFFQGWCPPDRASVRPSSGARFTLNFKKLSFNSSFNILSSSRSSLFLPQKTSGKEDDRVCQKVEAQEQTEPDGVRGSRSSQSLKTKVLFASCVSFKYKYVAKRS